MLLAGKKIVVVGGSSGIGLATAELAKSEGADVTIASRNAERLKAAAEKMGVIAIPADVTSDESVAGLFRKCGPGGSCCCDRGSIAYRPLQDRFHG
jgi:NAD(P)-dependent dehydrogenase (short-subunit alcohol dehydrogenase family)